MGIHEWNAGIGEHDLRARTDGVLCGVTRDGKLGCFWNSRPLSIGHSSLLSSCKSELKTSLFSAAC